MHVFLQQLINGLSLGAIYALIAVGYTMVYGVLRLINFAHGDVFMVGAMMGLYVATGSFNLFETARSHPLLWLPVALVALAILGILMALRVKRIKTHWTLDVTGKVVAAAAVSALIMDLGGRLIRLSGAPSWLAFFITIVAAMVVCGCLGFVIELVAYRPLRNQPRITSLITAIGISMFLEYGGQGVFGATPQTFPDVAPIAHSSNSIAAWQLPQTFHVHGVTVSFADTLIVAVTLVLMAGLTWIVKYTRTGMALRAVSFRFDTAALMGINIDRIISFAFVLGSMLAAAGGVLVAVRSPSITPLMGLMPGIKAFVAAVLGGIGNIPGAVAGGFLLGLVEVLVSAYMPQGSQYRDAIAFVILIAILLVKPTGLFGRNLVEKV
ncbi:MAG: ABC-type transporter, integral rane subunit [Phycisphaerales bacterium]|nr:ABC-type transporter, integral rane subunit [Phycisphaerales bacterium]